MAGTSSICIDATFIMAILVSEIQRPLTSQEMVCCFALRLPILLERRQADKDTRGKN